MTEQMKHEVWQNCYAHGWAEGELIGAAFEHPAKMARGLVYRIVSEGLKRGWWTKDTLVLDIFGGIGSTGLACSAFGIRSVLVELEEKFVRLARENFALHEKDWQAMGYPAPQIIQGDSRRLLEILQEAGGGGIRHILDIIPPSLYNNGEEVCNADERELPGKDASVERTPARRENGVLEEPAGIYNGAICERRPQSTRFSGHPRSRASKGSQVAEGSENTSEEPQQSRGTTLDVEGWAGAQTISQAHSQEPLQSVWDNGQVANSPQGLQSSEQRPRKSGNPVQSVSSEPAQKSVVARPEDDKLAEWLGKIATITSPPFLQASGGGGGITAAHEGRSTYPNKMQGGKLGSLYNPSAIGQTKGQISSMKEGSFGALTSPPYAEIRQDGGHTRGGYGAMTPYSGEARNAGRTTRNQRNIGNLPIGALTSPPYEKQNDHARPLDATRSKNGRHSISLPYGATIGQIGIDTSETYWGACRLIYEQLYQLFSPGSHLVVVVKAFVRNKKIVDLPGMTLALLEDIGFAGVAWMDAKLAEEGTQSSAFPELVAEKQRKRVSFFRRLHESKYPHLALNEEVVLVVKK